MNQAKIQEAFEIVAKSYGINDDDLDHVLDHWEGITRYREKFDVQFDESGITLKAKNNDAGANDFMGHLLSEILHDFGN